MDLLEYELKYKNNEDIMELIRYIKDLEHEYNSDYIAKEDYDALDSSYDDLESEKDYKISELEDDIEWMQKETAASVDKMEKSKTKAQILEIALQLKEDILGV